MDEPDVSVRSREFRYIGTPGKLMTYFPDRRQNDGRPVDPIVDVGGFNPPLGWFGKQVTVSEKHAGWSRRKAGEPLTDIGGEFSMTRRYIEHWNPDRIRRTGAEEYYDTRLGERIKVEYQGPVLPEINRSDPYPPSIQSSESALDAFGAKAIDLVKPTNSTASAATALIELYREGLPHLVGHATWDKKVLRAKDAGGDYLNVEFGWKPLANDIASFAAGVVGLNELLYQFERDAGRVVRRRHVFPPIVNDFSVKEWNGAIPFIDPSNTRIYQSFSNPQGATYTRRESFVSRWFSGAFTYYLPSETQEGRKVRQHASLAQKLLGIDLTPEVVWNLTPWSWAVDWFTNLGSIISNYTSWANDGLVLRYGYMMEHSLQKWSYYHHGPTALRGGDSLTPAIVSFVTETKLRRKATPFGFGFTAELTDRQKAILAALGISRRRK